MKIDFWSSTEYGGFLAGLIRELNTRGSAADPSDVLRADPFDKLRAGQRYQISEASYRAAQSPRARLFLRFRQYVAYPLQLCAALVLQRIRHGVKVERWKSGKVGDHARTRGPSNLPTFKPSHSDHDCIVVSTNTFYAPLLATYLHPNVVHLVYDLFPEAMIHSGKWREGSLKVKLVRWITRKTLARAQCNIFLGERLKDYVESIHGPVKNSTIIAVGADQSLFPLSPKQRLGESESESESEGGVTKAGLLPESPLSTPNLHSEPTAEDQVDTALRPFGGAQGLKQAQGSIKLFPTILYCGNFGNMHDTPTLFEFWRRSATLQRAKSEQDKPTQTGAFAEAARYVFHCSGPKRAALEAVHRELPAGLRQAITLGGGLSQAEWVARMESAQVALVTMAPGAETVVMPSKTYSAMMAGQAILAIAPEDSDLVDLVKVADCGWWVEPGDVDGLESALEQICGAPAKLLEKRENAFHYAHRYFGQDVLAQQWRELFGQ